MVIIKAIIVPFNTISNILSLDFVASDNMKNFENGNKNQRDFIKSCSHQTLIENGFCEILSDFKKEYFLSCN